MPGTIYLVTGGARSGKSTYAERLCEQLCQTPVYVATGSHEQLSSDDDFADRIKRHQQDREHRGNVQWTTIEEPLKPSLHASQFSGKAVLLDCLTLWLTNYMLEEGAFSVGSNGSRNTEKQLQEDVSNQKEQHQTVSDAVDRALAKVKEEFDVFVTPYNVTVVVVTNEVGSGTHADTLVTRKFVDAQGWLNQFVAKKADQVIHMVCGIPNIIKDNLNSHARSIALTTPRTGVLAQKALEAQRLDRHLSARKVPMDEKGYFLISTNVEECTIVASFHSCMVNDKGEVCDLDGNKIGCHDSAATPAPLRVWKCRTAKELTTEIFEQWEYTAATRNGDSNSYSNPLQLSLGHAAYIAREAQKAEHCLYDYINAGRTYQQD